MGCSTATRIEAIIEFGVAVVLSASDAWNAVPVRCNDCGNLMTSGSIGKSVSVGWCPKCRQIFRLPVLKIPNWVAGVMVILCVKLLGGM
jgi:hypothetical protein